MLHMEAANDVVRVLRARGVGAGRSARVGTWQHCEPPAVLVQRAIRRVRCRRRARCQPAISARIRSGWRPGWTRAPTGRGRAGAPASCSPGGRTARGLRRRPRAGTRPPPDPTPTATPEEQALAWTESVCAALVPVVARLTAAPGFDLGAPEATRQAYLTYLDEGLATTDRARAALAAAGPAPVPDGDVIAEQVRGDVADLRADLAEARDQVRAHRHGQRRRVRPRARRRDPRGRRAAQRRRGGRDDQPRPDARGRLRAVAVVRAAAALRRARHRTPPGHRRRPPCRPGERWTLSS